MKTKHALKKRLATRIISGAVLVGMITIPATANEKSNHVKNTEDPAKKGKITKRRSAKKGKTVKIYPDLFKRAMHVVSNHTNDGQVDFYVFAVDGTLVSNHRLAPGEHIKVSDLERGTYMYQVFDGDEMTENGKLEVK